MKTKKDQANIPEGSTKERISNAAEILFSEHGYENVSMKNITDLAQTNIASVNYHFGTKLRLLADVFSHRARDLNKERLHRLQECAITSKSGEIEIEEILRAFLEPSYRTGQESEHGKHFQRIMSQMSASPNSEVRQILFQTFNKVSQEFLSLLKKACKNISREEFYWRVSFIYGAMMYVHSNNGRIQSLAGSGFDAGDMTKAVHYMVPFLAEGMQMTATKKPKKTKRTK